MSAKKIGILGCGMIAELGHLLATRIARLATEEAMRDREPTSQSHPSTMVRAANTVTPDAVSPLDTEEPDDLPPSTLATLFERTKQ